MYAIILDHYCHYDHLDSCKLVSPPERDAREYGLYDIGEILTAIRFYFEEHVDDTGTPVLEYVIRILEKYYGFKEIQKEPYMEALKYILDTEAQLDYPCYDARFINRDTWLYIDMWEAREKLCGPGQPEKLYNKWLTDDIKAEILKIPCEQ